MKNAKFYIIISVIALLITWFLILVQKEDEGTVQHWNADKLEVRR